MNMTESVSELRGVGDSLVKKLEKLRVETVNDLIHHYPRRYDDFSQVTPIAQLQSGQVTIKGKILRVASRRTFRKRLNLTEALIDDGSGAVKAIWFNQPYLANTLPKDTEVFISGKLELKGPTFALQNPVVEKVSDFPKNTARIVPIYPETAGLSSKQIRALIQQVLPVIKRMPEDLPNSIIKSEELIFNAQALEQIHFPASVDKLEQAKYRIAFEELFMLILAGLVIKSEIQTEDAHGIPFEEELAKRFTTSLPFTLTNAQRKAAWQILKDIDSQTPMNRLLEGDVGSGKTAVAAMAAAMAANAGYQTALMAPTEVLARQHFKSLVPLLKKLKIETQMLLGGTSAKDRKKILEQLGSGQNAFIIGTHALLEPDVQFIN